MRTASAALLAAAVAMTTGTVARAEPIKLATWNVQHLRDSDDEGPNPRTQADFDRLSGYVGQLDADVIALQEVEGGSAAARIFDPDEYVFFFPDQDLPQLSGFAVRKTIEVVQNPDLDLNVTGSLRNGTDITISVNGQPLRLLSVHLKSGCFSQPLSSSSNDCVKLKQQLPALEAWIDARALEQIPFVVMGDWNRRFDSETEIADVADRLWASIDDADPVGLDLSYPDEGITPECWNSEFTVFIDHIVMDTNAIAWFGSDSFSQLVYTDADDLKDVLSDHCPIAVSIDPAPALEPAVASTASRTELLERLQRIEQELEALRGLVMQLPTQ